MLEVLYSVPNGKISRVATIKRPLDPSVSTLNNNKIIVLFTPVLDAKNAWSCQFYQPSFLSAFRGRGGGLIEEGLV